MPIPRPRLNAIELLLLGIFVGAMAYIGGRYSTEVRLAPFLSRGAGELQALQQKYGPAHSSRYGEEWILRDYLQDMRDGVFVDVGANDYKRDSNTYYLETELGWSGMAIEPQTKFAADYKSYRPRTVFVPLFVSDTSNAQAVLYVPDNDLVASSTPAFVQAEGGQDAKPLSVNTTTLNDILDRQGITAIDFMSIDIELHEPEALRGFDIERFRPRLVCIEAHEEVRQQILDYFAAHGYVVLGKYLRADSENLWFAPLERHAKAESPAAD